MQFLSTDSFTCKPGSQVKSKHRKEDVPGIILFEMIISTLLKGFPGDSYCQESACNAGDKGSVPGLGRSLGGGRGKPSSVCIPGESPRTEDAWWATVHGDAESDTTE